MNEQHSAKRMKRDNDDSESNNKMESSRRDFLDILAEGPAASSAYFAQKPNEIPEFLTYLHKSDTSSVTSFAAWSLWLLVSGKDATGLPTLDMTPDEYLRSLAENTNSTTVCGALFKPGSMVITCKDCGMDPTCAICMPCFLASDHKGHDYTIHPSGGGVCDCGDPQAWRQEGFCTKHSGVKENFDPAEVLPLPVVQSAHLTIRVIIDIIVELLLENKDISPYVALLDVIQEYGEAFKNIIAKELGTPSSASKETPVIAMDLLISLHSKFSKELRNSLHAFYLKMIVDYAFKRVFLKYHGKYYENTFKLFLDDSLGKGAETTAGKRSKTTKGLLDLGVQLFTVPSVALELVKSDNLLETLLNTLSSALTAAWIEKYQVIDCANPIIEESLFWRSYIDIKYCITNKNVAQYCVYTSDLLSKMLHVLGLVQGTNPYVRKTDSHVVTESPWLNAVNLELNILRLLEPLMDGYKCGPSGDLTRDITTEEMTNSLKTSVSLVLSYVKITLDLWFQRHETLFSARKNIMGQSILSYDVAKQPISIHLTLHRVFASFLAECTLASPWRFDLQELLQLSTTKSSIQFVELLLEEPLRIQAFFAQIRAGMWVRNGASMHQMSYSYHSSTLYAPKTYAYDIYIMQVCAVLLTNEKFILTCIDRYGLLNFFTFNENAKKTEESDKFTMIAEDFVAMLITIISERMLVGNMDSKDFLRRFIIHRLCVGDTTHSKLVEAIPKPWAKHPDFDQVLNSVANYIDPNTSTLRGSSSMKQGMYTLKTEFWREYEGKCFLFYSREDLQESLGRYQEYINKNPQQNLFIKPYSQTRSVGLQHAFTKLESFVDNSMLHSFIFLVLYNVYVKNPIYSDTLLSYTLTLLYYCIDMSNQHTVTVATSTLNEAVHFDSHNMLENMNKVNKGVSMLQIVLELLQRKELKEQHGILQGIVNLLERKHGKSAEAIQKTRSVEEMGKTEEEEDPEAERKRRLKLQQQKILQQFQDKQKAFSMKMKQEETEDISTSEHLELEVPECCLCRDISESYETNPIALISYSQLSYNIQVSERRSIPSDSPLTPQIHISNCGHYIHVECFHRYYTSLLARHMQNQLYEGKYVIDLEEGEFLCPTCRKISNSLLPLVDGDIQVSKEESQQEFEDWVAHGYSEVQSVTKTALNDAFDTLATRCTHMLNNTKPGKIKDIDQDLPKGAVLNHFWNAIANTIKSLELSLRDDIKYSVLATVNSKIKRDFFYLVNAGFQYVNKDEKSELANMLWNKLGKHREHKCVICNKVTTTRCSKCKSVYYCSRECQKQDRDNHKDKCIVINKVEISPLLSSDLFHYFVKMCYSYGDKRSIQDLLYIVRELVPALIVQCIATALYVHYPLVESNQKSPESIVQLTKVLGKVWEKETEGVLPWEHVKNLSLPFLRCVAMFVNACNLESPFCEQYNELLLSVSPSEEFEALWKLLKLPEIDSLVIPLINNSSLLSEWVADSKDSMKLLPPTKAFQLISLESEFQDLLTHWADKPCNKCKTVPKIPALCLFCGNLICVHSSCCKEPVDDYTSLSETVQHMRKCSGQGIFFLFKECAVLLARRVDGAYVNGGFFNSVYLDKYGEEDVGFRRGKPLFLEKNRYEELRKLWLNHGMDEDIVKRGPKHYSL